MRENTNQKNSECGHFLRSEFKEPLYLKGLIAAMLQESQWFIC